MTETQTLPPIAVVGVSALFPGSSDARGFWRDILAAKDLITDVPERYWRIEDYYDPDPSAPDKTYSKRGGFLNETPFDCMAFGTPPNLVPATDTAQLLGLVVAQKVLEDACQGSFDHLDKSRVSCILGATGATELVVHLGARLQRPIWLHALRDSGIPEDAAQGICDRIAAQYVPWQEASFPGLLGNVVAGRIANRFDLGGTNCIVDAACASSLSALEMGLNELYLGQSDMCITGGVDTLNDILMYMCFSKTPALSPTDDCRPFSDRADGTILGEGLGMVALRRLVDAERDGDRIYAILRGIGSSSDGRSKSVYAPRPEGQATALERCYTAAGYGPETVELVEAHGTGTIAGDAAEFQSLSMIFDSRSRNQRQWCALGSIKSQIGHTKGAAGAASLFKAVMALHHKVLPPTLKVDRPNPNLDIANSPFYINTEARPWIRNPSHPRRASVSSFGFGGTNFHTTLEEYPDTPPSWRFRPSPTELVIVTGQTASALCESARTLCEDLLEVEDGLAILSRESLKQFDADMPTRLAVVAESMSDLQHKLDVAVATIEASPNISHSSPLGWWYGSGGRSGKLAFLFPGQGSQYRFMGADLAMAFDIVRDVWDQAAEQPLDGTTRLHERVFPLPVFNDEDLNAQEAALRETEWAQPAIGISSLSMLALVRALGLAPDCVGGHSFGEVTALFAAGVLDAESLLSIARQRGKLMAEAASRPGSMTAVSHPADALRALLSEWQLEVVLANHNSPTQSVLSGQTEVIAEAESKLEEAGIRFQRLPVATAFHSDVVSPASLPFKDFLDTIAFNPAQLPVYANSEAAPYPEPSDAKRRILAEALAKPVRFVEQLEAMAASGVETFIEIGPNSVLTKLVDATLGDRALSVSLDHKGRSGLTSLWHALGQLAARGFALDFSPLIDPLAPLHDPRATPQSNLVIPLSGVNHDKPYPSQAKAHPIHPMMKEANPMSAPYISPVSTPPVVADVAATPNPTPTPVPDITADTELPPAPSISLAPESLSSLPPTPAPPVSAAPAMSETESLQWVEAFQTLQQQTTDAHMAFLRVAERSLISLESMLTGRPDHISPAPVNLAPTNQLFDNSVPQPPASHPPVTTSPAPPLPAPLRPPTGVPVAPSPLTMPTHQEALPATPQLDLKALMLEVVSEKTGYPQDMLGLGMELEADLGIDSIKRVEILSAMQERAPSLPEIDLAQMATLRSLGAIVDFMDTQLEPTSSTSVLPAQIAPPSTASLDLKALMLEVVSEKTGYPQDMLGLDMELEADLGIDSIKRVEILSAMQERAPSLPEIDLAQMATLRSLGAIVDFMNDQAPLLHDRRKEGDSESVALAPPGPSAQRFEVTLTKQPPPGFSLPHLADGKPVFITDEGTGVAVDLAAILRKHGIAAETCTEVPTEAQVVLVLDGLRHVINEAEALTVNRTAFRRATQLASSFEERGGALVFVQDTGGDFGVSASESGVWLGGLTGLAKTAALEWPKATLRAIDLERGTRNSQELATVLATELLQGGSEREVGLTAAGDRYVPSVKVAAAPPGAARVDAQSVIVASGGARGVTAASLIALARSAQPNMVLLGRTALEDEPADCRGITNDAELKKVLMLKAHDQGQSLSPLEVGRLATHIHAMREVRETIAQLEAAGSRVLYFSCDVSGHASVAAALDQAREHFGPITGLIHGAGVLADKRLTEKTEAHFDQVFGAKVLGLQALLAATSADPLTLLIFYASVAGRAGNIGQSDYAMANEILNRVAQRETCRRPEARVCSIGWGPWQSGMVTPGLEAMFHARGIALLPLDEGATHFVRECQSSGATEIVIGGAANAEALAGTQPTSHYEFDVLVTAESHPYLYSHQIQDVPVLPMVLVQEWFVRAVRVAAPESSSLLCRDLQVLQGVRLTRFESGEHFIVHLDEQESKSSRRCFALTLVDGKGQKRYTASIETQIPSPPSAEAPTLELVHTYAADDLYRSRLFHGPNFAALHRTINIGEKGATAELIGTLDLGWPGHSWQTDPGLLDGGLQLARVWGYECLGLLTLPTRITEFALYVPGPLTTAGPVHCVLQGIPIGQAGTRTDLVFVSDNGQVLAELRGLEMHATLEVTETRPSAA